MAGRKKSASSAGDVPGLEKASGKKKAKDAESEGLPRLPMADFPDAFVGHDEVLSVLGAMVSSPTIPHAILLHGPKGVGKRLLAQILAYRLLCGADLRSGGLAFDVGSPLFPQLEAGSSPDFFVLEPTDSKFIKIEPVREVLRRLSLASDGKRVVIVDAAEDMNLNAANALLKTLEEPAAGVHLILISHNISKLLPTIISRCRSFRLGRLTDGQTTDVLRAVADHAGVSVDVEALAVLAEGSPGQAFGYVGLGEEVAQALDEFWNKLPPRARVPLTAAEASLTVLGLCEKLGRKKGACELAMDFVVRHVAHLARDAAAKGGQGAGAWADLYALLQKRLQQMKEFNLTPQLALEVSLLDVVGCGR